jgi:hypothetical protein
LHPNQPYNSIEASEKVLYSLSLRERVGVRDSRILAIAGVSLLLTSSLREEEQKACIHEDKFLFKNLKSSCYSESSFNLK